MWVIKLFIAELVFTLIIAFAIYGVWRSLNPGKKF